MEECREDEKEEALGTGNGKREKKSLEDKALNKQLKTTTNERKSEK